jgi:hypothetical protein
MIGEEKLHHAFAGFVGEGRVGLHDHAGLDGPCARGDRFGCSFYLYQAHTAVASYQELLMVAVSGNSCPRLLAGLDQGGTGYCGSQGEQW